MTFLTPWIALAAALAAVPLLLLLYFLRLRRQALRVPSTLLWLKAFEDLQVNVPFQRLRWSVLLILQLLMLLLLLGALAEPMWRAGPAGATRIVLLIDRSASMTAAAPGAEPDDDGARRTRFDLARDAARKIIDSVGRSQAGGPAQMMIAAFGSSASVIVPFTSDRRELLDGLNSIAPTHEQANLDAGLQLAGAFAGTGDDLEAIAHDPPEVVLISDGGVSGADPTGSYTLRSGKFRFVRATDADDAEASRNVGITSFSARRDYDDPARVQVFARLVNAGLEAVDAVATLSADGQPIAWIRKTIPAAGADGPGEASFTQALDLGGGALLSLRHNLNDDFAADDEALLRLPAPAQPRIAVVYGGAAPDPFLMELLEALEPQQLRGLSRDAYASLDARELDAGTLFDLVVFDGVSAARLPGVPTLTVGGAPAPLKTVEASSPGGRHILSWDRQHPLLRHVSLDTVVFADFGAFDLPATATPLVFGPDGPIMAVARTRGARHVAIGFSLVKSNWPLHVSSAVFIQNAVEFLTWSQSGQGGLVHRPGEPVMIRASANVDELAIEGPISARISVEPGGMASVPTLRRAGLYRVEGAMPPNDLVAVSVLSDVESDIRPRPTITVNAEHATARRAASVSARPLWPWLVGIALALLALEWLVYCRKLAG